MTKWLALMLVGMSFSLTAFGRRARVHHVGPMAVGGSMAGMQKPLEVKGQTRNLAILQTANAQKSQINFVRLRNNYRPEIMKQNY